MVAEVRVVGNKSLPLEKITPFIQTRAGRAFDDDLVKDDVRRLYNSKMFLNVNTYFQNTPQGRIIIYEVTERPMLLEIKYVGNSQVRRKKLEKEAGLKAGDPFDPFAVEEARRKLEDYYRSNGYDKARVTLLEGDKPQDRRAVFLINEGVKQKVQLVTFVGNTIASDARLRTQIKTHNPYVFLFKGELDRRELDEDVDRLTAYYRSLGFFRARIGREVRPFDINEHHDPELLASRALRELDQFETVQWMVVTFIIDEGPRYKVRNVSVVGNKKFTSEQLLADLKLQNNQYFNQAQMTADVASIQDKYGGEGYVFADVKADPRFLEEPGTLDLVYKINEGDRYRVGNINVVINGEYPHTKITTVLDRLSLKPGDIVDIREIRASERRLRYSQLFENNPGTGEVPKIVFSPPEKNLDEENRTEMARRPKSPPKFRGQSPDPSQGTWYAPQRSPAPQTREQTVNLVLNATATNPEKWQQEPDRETSQIQTAPRFIQNIAVNTRRQSSIAAVAEQNQSNQMLVRGQYTPDDGRSTPAVFPGPSWGGARPTATSYPTTQQGGASAASSSTAYPSTAAATADANQSAQSGPIFYQPAPNTAAAQTAGSQPAPVQSYPNQYSATEPTPAQAQPVYGNQQSAETFPYNAAGALPPPERPVEPIIPYDSPFSAVPPSSGDPTLPLPLDIRATETQTGRFMFGVGINSDAGLFGSIVIDEQNFDLFHFPRGWDDIRNFTAWRGAGQRLRIEAVPGTEVQRYMINFQEPYLFNKYSLGLSGYYYSRSFTEWFEERVGGRVALGYQFTHDLSGSLAYRGARVNISKIIDESIPELAEVKGNSALHGFSVQLAHDTRDNPFLATEGHLIQGSLEEVIGTYQYPRAELDLRRHFTLHERPDGSGRHVFTVRGFAGYTGDDTPVYEHYFAGGFSTIRGFDFRGASPRAYGSNINDWVFVGGQFELLASAEYMFPITADDMLRGVVFCDTGTVEPSVSNWSNQYRVAPGFGLRVLVPAMGPAPIAFDFAFPVSWNSGDRFEVFSFFIGFGR
jgi:outer membrane protein insertion porin family